jgi:hypothetical protein
MELVKTPIKYSTTQALYQILNLYLQIHLNNIISNFAKIYSNDLTILQNFNLIINEIKWTQYSIFIYNFLENLPYDISINETIALFNKIIIIESSQILDNIRKVTIKHAEKSSNNLINIRLALSKNFSFILSANILARIQYCNISMEILMIIIKIAKSQTLNIFFEEIMKLPIEIINHEFVENLFLENLDKYIDISLKEINERVNSNFWYNLQFIDYISYA